MAGLLGAYDADIQAGRLRRDARQRDAAQLLDALATRLDGYQPAPSGRALFGLLRRDAEPAPQGLYLWGGVGRGKSMLMDLFFAHVNVARKRRVHFHAFMEEMHSALARARSTGGRDPLAPVAAKVAAEAHLLCFDEMQILDIADAMLVGRLFEKLFAAGVVVVTTSNRIPDDLYKDGLNRQLFVPFIEMLKTRMEVSELSSDTDHRRDTLSDSPRYFAPANDAAEMQIDQLWAKIAGGHGAPMTIAHKGRDIALSRAVPGIARASFEELCGIALGPSDYLALTGRITTLFIENVPQLGRARADAAKRFVTLIDAAYEAGTCLIISAADAPESLYGDGPGAFEFERTASRLREICFGIWPKKE